MVLNKGGYVMINKAQDNVYELATSALTSGKPILWYESDTECYFIDTITLSGTDIILTKGGKTITIENDGDITESGSIQPTEKTLYQHSVLIKGKDVNYGQLTAVATILFISTDNTPITTSNYSTKLPLGITCAGYYLDGGNMFDCYRLNDFGPGSIEFNSLGFDGVMIQDRTERFSTLTITDTVTTL